MKRYIFSGLTMLFFGALLAAFGITWNMHPYYLTGSLLAFSFFTCLFFGLIELTAKIMISLTVLFTMGAWAGLIAITVNSGLDLKWMLFIAGFGGMLILTFGGWLCQNLAMSNKKRHATLVTKRSERYLRSHV